MLSCPVHGKKKKKKNLKIGKGLGALESLNEKFSLFLLTPKRWPRVREKPTARATEPSRPFRLSSYVAKMQSTNWSVRKISTVVAWPTLTPACNWAKEEERRQLIKAAQR